jgi:GrpB-like predicted nucleotidyltransferase (UPF0157 family)
MLIGSYTPSEAHYLPYNWESSTVAGYLASAIIEANDRLKVEHIGSTAVPGCWGKGIIDLLVTHEDLQSAKNTLDGLGFQRQTGPEVFPESRPMRVGSIEFFGRIYRIHAHIIEEGSPEARDLVRFRDLLRADAELLRAYEAQKREILARGITKSTEYSKAKGDFIRRALGGARKPVPTGQTAS